MRLLLRLLLLLLLLLLGLVSERPVETLSLARRRVIPPFRCRRRLLVALNSWFLVVSVAVESSPESSLQAIQPEGSLKAKGVVPPRAGNWGKESGIGYHVCIIPTTYKPCRQHTPYSTCSHSSS